MSARAHEPAIQRELLRLALHNSSRSVPLQLLAVGVIALIGIERDDTWAAGAVMLLGLLVAIWRLWIAREFGEDTADLDVPGLGRATLHLEGNAALAGLQWVVAAVGIYPGLHGTVATAFVTVACGSISIAAFFLSLVGRSFVLLAGPQIAAIAAVSIYSEEAGSTALAILVVLYGFTMLHASKEFQRTAIRSIRAAIDARQANESLTRAKEAAESANLAKSQFLAMMSHEIRTPMNGVLGALELLRGSELDAQQRRLVRTAASSGESLMHILNDVLDHSKIEAGKLNLSLGPAHLHALAQGVINLFRANAESRQLSLTLRIDPGVVDAVHADRQRLKQVLMNLVGNAIKFTERGGVELRLRARGYADDGRPRVEFVVRDTGIGIAAESQERLFQPFQQVEAIGARRRSGTGLGLSISQRIIEAMGGVIAVASRPGEGSRFYFALAFERDEAPITTVSPDSIVGALDSVARLQGHVLLVEDNPVNRVIAQEMLAGLGVTVTHCENGAEALHLIERQRFDLVLMDCQMPIMDGYDATARIRAREAHRGLPRMPIVALTANAFDDDAAHALASGMDAHLAKPYTRAQLCALLAQWL